VKIRSVEHFIFWLMVLFPVTQILTHLEERHAGLMIRAI
jgi:hypothetical protein